MRPLVLDFETYYDTDYTLRKRPTSTYIADSRFEVIMLTYVDMETGEVGEVSHPYYKEFLLDSHYEQRAAVAHNASFDLTIIKHHYGLAPKLYVCTQMMAYAVVGNHLRRYDLDSVAELYGFGGKDKEALTNIKGLHRNEIPPDKWDKLTKYGIRDSVLCGHIFNEMKAEMSPQMWRQLDWCVRQTAEPILRSDKPLLVAELRRMQEASDKRLERLGVTLETLRSDTKFADVLVKAGVEPPTEISPRTGKVKFAFSKQSVEFTEMAEHHESDLVRDLCEARLEAKSTIATSRMTRLVEMHDALSGLQPMPVNFCGAVQTGRPSGRDKINMLNLPRGSTLRKAVAAPTGYRLVAADLSGAELRACRMVTGDTESIDSIRQGGDLYSQFMAQHVLSGVSVDDVTKDQRFTGKVCELSLQYATGHAKLRHTLYDWGRARVSIEEAKRLVHIFRKVAHAPVPQYWRYLDNVILPMLSNGSSGEIKNMPFAHIEDGKIHMPSGFWLEYPDLHWSTRSREWVYKRGKERHKIYGGHLLENICQCLTNEIIVPMAHRLEDAGYRVAHSVYDEIICCVPVGKVWDCADTMQVVMSASPDWWQDIPLATEVGIGRNYFEAK